MNTKYAAIAAAGIVAVGLGVGGYFMLQDSPYTCGPSTVVSGNAAIGGPFELVSHTGEIVTDADVITGPSIVYFGYTYCPDFCPLDVQRNVEAAAIAAEQGVTIKPVFITIDPERDTVEALADYVFNVDENMIALTGTAAQIKAASEAYRTFYRKTSEDEDYLVDHSTFSYFMDETGFIDVYRRDLSPEALAEKMICQVRS